VIRPASKVYDGLAKSREVGYYRRSASIADEVAGDQISNDQPSLYLFLVITAHCASIDS
jgi:hypothetical protein